ncbi:MAG: hypothetical protein GYB67_02645 [Chloroflexi bacterium]|nr:hypothetical protein [Chloroflexota bacterium]
MLRLTLLLTPLLLLLLALPLAWIHTRPYTAPDIRAILAPDGCPAPCWQTIRAGSTRLAEAEARLHQHPWIAADDPFVSDISPDSGLIRMNWGWSGAQPTYVDAAEPGRLRGAGGFVEQIDIETTFAFGDLWLQLGPPDGLLDAGQRGTYQALWYRDFTVTLRTPLDCARFWHQPVRLEFAVYRSDPRIYAVPYAVARMQALACQARP